MVPFGREPNGGDQRPHGEKRKRGHETARERWRRHGRRDLDPDTVGIGADGDPFGIHDV
jgi:hypothetical protein